MEIYKKNSCKNIEINYLRVNRVFLAKLEIKYQIH